MLEGGHFFVDKRSMRSHAQTLRMKGAFLMRTLQYAPVGLLSLVACQADGVSTTEAAEATAGSDATSTGSASEDEGKVVVDDVAFCGEASPVVVTTCGNSQADPGEFCVSNEVFVLPEPAVVRGYSLALGDFDTDGSQDVIANGFFYRGTSQGLVYEGSYSWNGVQHVTVGDVDNDGKPDIVAVRGDETSVSASLADPNFPHESRVLAPFSGGPTAVNHRVMIADVDSDGLSDVIIAYKTYDTYDMGIKIALQKSGSHTGTFEAPVRLSRIETDGFSPLSIPLHGVRDIDLDGDMDIIVSPRQLLINDGTGVFSARDLKRRDVIPELQFACGSLPLGVAIESLTPDELPLVGYNQATSKFDVYPDADLYFLVLGAAPINNDTAYDLFLTNNSGVHIAFGLGDGSFDMPPLQISTLPAHRVGFHDVNDDNRLDFVLLGSSDLEIFVANQ